jgi:translation elongation factor EF-1alpha
VKRILFAINFMDGCLINIYEIVFPGCNWSRDHYNSIVGQLQTLCSLIKYKSDALQTAFVPTSSLNGENIQRESPIDILVEHGVCRWMVEDKVPSFIQCFEEFIIV